jgi:ABC-type Fe3+ transport system permease subunit
MPELQDYIWMREQWRRFRHILIGALTGVLIVCASGLVVLRAVEEAPEQWVFARVALMILLVSCTCVALWLWFKATREVRHLGELITAARLEAARKIREEKAAKKARRRS